MTNRKLLDYRELNTELDEILEKLQGGELDIDDAIKAYKRGAEIIKELQVYLRDAQNKVTKVQKQFS